MEQLLPFWRKRMQEKVRVRDIYYDYYNKRWVNSKYFGTITTCTAHNGSGTFYVLEKVDKCKKK